MSVVRAITIRDVAQKADVSLSTVSQVLNGRPGYASPATRDRVLAAARDLGYRPNALARGLVTSRTGTLGVVITDITRGFFTQVVGSIEQVASEQGYSVLLACAEGVRPEQRALETFIDKRVDGIICMSSTASTSADHILKVNRLGRPAGDDQSPARHVRAEPVRLGRPRDRAAGDGSPARAGAPADRAPERPGQRGRPPLGGGPGRAATRRRCAAAGIPLDESLIVDGGYDYATAFAACGRLFDRDDPPTAVFAASDVMAAAIINALHRRHVQVPEDVSVVGANDDQYAVHVEPPLTTVRLPVVAAGRRAAELILADDRRPDAGRAGPRDAGERADRPGLDGATAGVVRSQAVSRSAAQSGLQRPHAGALY